MITLDADLDIHPDHVAVTGTPTMPRKNSLEFESADMRINLTKEARERGLSHIASLRAQWESEKRNTESTERTISAASLSRKMDTARAIQDKRRKAA